MIAAGILLFLAAFALSLVVTGIARRAATRLKLVDNPGQRKVHTIPTPRNGGIGIFWGLGLPIFAGILAISFLSVDQLAGLANLPPEGRDTLARYLPGMLHHRNLAVLLLATTLAMHLLGLLDDRVTLPPWPKLLGQLAIAAALVGIGEMMEPGAFRLLTMLDRIMPGGIFLSALLSILWITALTNAFNFLDNMDGLAAGVAFIAALMFLISALVGGQWFISSLLVLFMGSLLGFLCYNFPPASIFMGDGGSMILGFFLSALTIRTTFYTPDSGAGRFVILVPLAVMAVPLYDLFIVSALRIARGRSPMTGDTNHFSHRLVRHGFSKRSAVLIIYAVTLASGLSAPLLSFIHDTAGAVLVAMQVAAMLVIIAILERVGEHTK